MDDLIIGAFLSNSTLFRYLNEKNILSMRIFLFTKSTNYKDRGLGILINTVVGNIPFDNYINLYKYYIDVDTLSFVPFTNGLTYPEPSYIALTNLILDINFSIGLYTYGNSHGFDMIREIRVDSFSKRDVLIYLTKLNTFLSARNLSISDYISGNSNA